MKQKTQNTKTEIKKGHRKIEEEKTHNLPFCRVILMPKPLKVVFL